MHVIPCPLTLGLYFVDSPPKQSCGFWDEQSEDSTEKSILSEIRIYIPFTFICLFLCKIKNNPK
jgi:hypothetical protein